MAKEKSGKGADQELSVEVKAGRLVISIGVNTLANAFNKSDYAEGFLLVESEHAVGFAKDVLEELLQEGDDGTTLVHECLDAACERAAENGSEQISEVEDDEAES